MMTMPEFVVNITATYQAEEEVTIKLPADNQEDAEELAVELAKADKLLDSFIDPDLSTSGGFHIYNESGYGIDYEARVVEEINET